MAPDQLTGKHAHHLNMNAAAILKRLDISRNKKLGTELSAYFVPVGNLRHDVPNAIVGHDRILAEIHEGSRQLNAEAISE